MSLKTILILIPLLPLVGVAINGLFGRRISRGAVGAIAVGTIVVAFILAFILDEITGEEQRGRST